MRTKAAIWGVRLAIIALVLSLGAVYRSWFQSEEPVWVATPTTAPACSFGSGSDTSGGGLVTVDSNPSSAVTIWQPGLNAHPCRPQLTRLTKAQAGAVATDIRRAPAFASGTYACPMDDATRVDLYFAYPGHTQSQLVVISLTGCRGIGAANRDTRTYPDQLNRDLAPVAPAAWASYVTI